MSEIISDSACPACQENGHDSKGDHLILFADGGQYCGKGHYHKSGEPYVVRGGEGDEEDSQEVVKTGSKQTNLRTAQVEGATAVVAIPSRGLTQETCQHFGIRCSLSTTDRSIEVIYFPVKKDGEVVAYKYKNLMIPKGEKFHFGTTAKKGEVTLADLFGEDKCTTTNKKLIVTEGEPDAGAGFQMLFNYSKKKFPDGRFPPNVVSLPSGASMDKDGRGVVNKDVLARKDFFMQFEEVVLCLDQDKAGQAVTEAITDWLGGDRVKCMKISEKDSNDMLLTKKDQEYISAMFKARKYAPPSLITVSDVFDEAVKMPTYGKPFPWESLTKITYGRRGGDGYMIGAGVKVGKCFGVDTKIRMADVSIKNVQDIIVGDKVMGEDGLPRTVTTLHTGYDEMFEIHQNKRMNYVVNSEHLLCTHHTTTKVKEDISVKDFLNKSKKYQIESKGYGTPVEFEQNELSIPPYILGVWLGDGHNYYPAITNMDREVIDEWINYATSIGYGITERDYNDSPAHWFYMSSNNQPHLFWGKLKEMRLPRNKHIPKHYMYSSREDRIELLSGLIDTDGSVSGKGYEVTFKERVLSYGVHELCLSLGYRSSVKEKVVNGSSYYRVSIFGARINCRVVRKQIHGDIKRNPLTTGIKVNPIGLGMYYGFTITGGSPRFLLEDYTVVHNSEFLNQMVAFIVKNEPTNKPLVIKGEEIPGLTAKKIAGKIFHKNYHDPTGDFTQEELTTNMESIRDSFFMYQGKDGLDWEDCKSVIRSAVMEGCTDVFIDPLTCFVDGTDPSKADTFLKGMVRDIDNMAKDLDFTYYIFCHLNNPPQGGKPHEEGGKVRSNQFTGSKIMIRAGAYIIGLERNKQAEDLVDRNTTLLRLIDDRVFGKYTEFPIFYNTETGDYLEPKINEAEQEAGM